MRMWNLFAGLCLIVFVSGCSNDQLSAGQADVVVTVQGESELGAWQRDFRGPEGQARAFAREQANIVASLAKEFEGAIEARVLIEGVEVEHIVVEGSVEEVVPAAIIASHDITALRLGFIPQGRIEDIGLSKMSTGLAPCTCVGAGCCCAQDSCGEIWLRCEGCGKKFDGGRCVPGTQCWVGNEEQS